MTVMVINMRTVIQFIMTVMMVMMRRRMLESPMIQKRLVLCPYPHIHHCSMVIISNSPLGERGKEPQRGYFSDSSHVQM